MAKEKDLLDLIESGDKDAIEYLRKCIQEGEDSGVTEEWSLESKSQFLGFLFSRWQLVSPHHPIFANFPLILRASGAY